MTDEAKAIAETAKLGQEVVKVASGAGGYLADMLGNVPKDLVGLLGGDWIGQQRQRNLFAMVNKTGLMLEGIAVERKALPSPAIAIPLLQAAVDESREELQELWAGLLANSSVDGGRKVRKQFIETLRKMDPLDAFALRVTVEVSAKLPPDRNLVAYVGRWDEVRQRLRASGWSEDEITVTAFHLKELGCVDYSSTQTLQSYGKLLIEACEVS